MNPSLLVELFTEELPPKALSGLGASFAGNLRDELVAGGFADAASIAKSFATPRRLAVLIPGVLPQSPGRTETRKLMPAKVAFDAAGKPTAALQKRLEKEGAATGQTERRADAGVENVYLKLAIAGVPLAQGLQAALEKTLAKLPIQKVMGYQLADGSTTVSFVRPAHGLVALHGAAVVPVRILGLEAGRITHGHRFQGVRDIEVAAADAWEEALRAHGKVIASFEERKAEIARQLDAKAKALGATLGTADAVAPLLDEVTALVEFPTVYAGEFEAEFLAVPQECLILTMRANQKYFPLFDAAGRLTNRFLIVSNMELPPEGQGAKNIVQGNQRVVRPRLADARFFFETDKKVKLAERVPQLAAIVFHNKLGSQLDRVRRIELIAEFVAAKLGANVAHAREAAQLAKADLGSNMVGEFPELQGLMGGYYAEHEGRPQAVAQAIRDQYLLRANDIGNPDNRVSACLYLADRVELLAGMFGIGNLPTGDKDPFALRRAALGAISVFEQLGAASKIGQTPTIELSELLAFARETFPAGLVAEATDAAVLAFVYERYRNQLVTAFDRAAVDAVIALTPPLHEVVARVKAVIAFGALPEAPALAAANKRIRNILKKADGVGGAINAALLAEPAERALHAALLTQEPRVEASFARQDYAGALKSLAGTRAAVDEFFDRVMVNAEDPVLRANRLALLAQLERLMNRVADISMLSA
ncbi:MAG: glycine--tRNA ligase subunit beta [Betaproteobacteria bacterium]|nr:glycine--tRNA ligase subunit beta [Betaproteobacteria bacterium]